MIISFIKQYNSATRIERDAQKDKTINNIGPLVSNQMK